MNKKLGESQKKPKRWPIALTEEHMIKVRQKGLKPEHIRAFIENYQNGGVSGIDSGDWKRLRSIIERTPSLQLLGDIGAGKTHLVTELIKNDHNHIYIVLDSHSEFDFLQSINTITPDLKESCRIKLPEQPQGAIGMFNVYYNLITNQQFPKHFVLVVEEGLRYKACGILNLLAESRKFLFVLAISQELLADFCPSIKVEPYNNYRL